MSAEIAFAERVAGALAESPQAPLLRSTFAAYLKDLEGPLTRDQRDECARLVGQALVMSFIAGKGLDRNRTLVDRLRGVYTIPVNDGCGLLDGKDTFTRTFQTPPIQHEAAREIESLNALLTDKSGNSLAPGKTSLSLTGDHLEVVVRYEMHPEDWDEKMALLVCEQAAKSVSPKMVKREEVVRDDYVVQLWSVDQ